MIEQLQYHTVDELRALSLEELQALWELVPTYRQRSYRAAYDREVRNAGAIGSDDLERRVAAELLLRYVDGALVPVGSRWAKTPERVQTAARENDLPEMGDEATQSTAGKPSPKVIAAMGIVSVIFLLFMLIRLVGGGSDESPEVALEATYTPTSEVSPTPTPLALEAQDDVITDGDADRAVAYPVNLQVILPNDTDGTAPPRVWVVQRRTVRAAEWNYDLNPDIASFVSGMSVRPVIGIPWSEDNAALFDSITEGAIFNLTMNTGAILTYEFAAKEAVLRSDTRIFRQVGPGLVLLLIGETDDEGMPTTTRTLVTASYPPEQELSRLDALVALVVESDHAAPTQTPTPPIETNETIGELSVQLVSATTVEAQITTHLRIYNGQTTPITFTPDDIWLSLGYAPDPPGPRNPAEGMQPFTLLPGQAIDLTLTWFWDGEPYGALQVGDYRFAIQLSRNN